MTGKVPSVRTSALILLLVVCWRILGAPVTAQDFAGLRTEMWQARELLGKRVARVLQGWMHPPEKAQEQPAISVYLTQENRLVSMTLEGYVCGVVAAEMPAKYHLEALKAQAVAARTRVLQQIAEGGCSLHEGADICTDSAHCQGYATLAECESRWGDSYSAYRDRIHQAGMETRGEVLTYDGELITVLYHAMSGGMTEDAQAVFSQSVPYLKSVESAGEEDAPGFYTETSFTHQQMAEKLRALPGCENLTAQQVQRTFAIASYTDTGRVSTLRAGDAEISAVDVRRALGLRSTWFSITSNGASVTFLQRGYGHGVGMSQVGANSMGAEGQDYAQILMHYYPGTRLSAR
ncbi:MAG: stage II sporulation protein D [bacterium]|nr:stage II sporulation protein D [bacterium]